MDNKRRRTVYSPMTDAQKSMLMAAFESGLTRTDRTSLEGIVQLSQQTGLSVVRVKVM
jgi:phage terminase large subunit-like protein